MNIAKVAEQYLDSHPSVKDCLRKKLINYSKLSRHIIREKKLKPDDIHAVLVACRRYYQKSEKADILEERILQILSQSKLEVRNRIAVLVVDKDILSEDLLDLEKKAKKEREPFYAIEGTRSITLVLSSDFLEAAKVPFRRSIRKEWQHLALIIVRSPEELQDETPGFLAFLAGRISERGINILEFMSCWSETLFVIDENDVAAMMSALG